MNEEDKEIVIDNKQQHFGYLHKMIQEGGSIKFNNSLFGIRFRGIGAAYVNIELFVIPSGTKYKGQINPSAPKKVKEEPKPFEPKQREDIVM